MGKLPVWSDGRLVEGGFEPAGPPSGKEGIALLETLRWTGERIVFLDEHLARLRRGARRLELPWPRWEPAEALLELGSALPAPPAGARGWALRLVLARRADGAASLAVTARAIERLPERGVSVALADVAIDSRAPHAGLKTTARERHDAARAGARALGAWDALLANERGELAEGCVTNVFLVQGGVLETPALASGCVAGIVRAVLLRELAGAPVHEGGGDAAGGELAIRESAPVAADLARASEVFLTNALQGVVPVALVLGLDPPAGPLPGAGGPVFRAVQRRFRRREEAAAGHGPC